MPDQGALLLLSAPSRPGLIERLTAVLAGAAPIHSSGDPHRLAIVAEEPARIKEAVALAIERLKKDDKPRFNLANRVYYAQPDDFRDQRRTAFLFPGFGARHPTLVQDLIDHFPAVRDWFEHLPESARDRLAANPLLFPDKAQGQPGFAETIDAVLAGTLAMHALLTRHAPGLACEGMTGHSYGETAALLASGMVTEAAPVLDLLHGLVESIVKADPESLKTATRTAMLAVTAASRGTLETFRANTSNTAVLALDNCPQQAILCGQREAMAELEQSLRARGNLCFRLPDLTIPVHTPLFPVSAANLAGIYADLPLCAPKVPLYSCATVAPFPAEPDAIRTLLAAQWTQTARFCETIERLYADGFRTFVEVGPGGHLAGFVRDILRGKDVLAIATNLENKGTLAQLRCFLAQMFVRGHDVDAAPFCASALAEAHTPCLEPRPVQNDMESLLRRIVAAILEQDSPDLLDTRLGFFDLGMSSLQAIDLVERLQAELGRTLAQTLPFDYPNIQSLATYLTQEASAATSTHKKAAADGEAIAIVGMGCRFPGGVSTPEQFWDLLDQGVDAMRDIPAERWDMDEIRAAGVDPATMPHIFRGGFLDEIRDFDCAFFGISPREAITLDPQQRLLLEVSREALEQAGIAPGRLKNSATGVFVGISSTEYAHRLTMAERLSISGYIGTGNAHSTAAGRLSFVMGLNGPCIALDTACSSSLVAVHLACRSLREGESHLALAGGVSLMVSPETSIFLARAGALARDSCCKTFDEAANGYVRAEGCGVVVLKRLGDALAAGDRVLAIIRGTAINHDGRTSGFTVPNGPAQQTVVRQALADASVSAAEISYIEAHGTGTALGDPIEVHALGEVFAGRPADRPLLLGSAKSNIGHLEAAAGVAGLIKVVLQLQHGRIARSLHFNTPNTRIGWERLPVKVVGQAQAWPRDGARLAGLSSFGISGSNAHAVIGEAPVLLEAKGTPRRHHVLTLSANSPAALDRLAEATAKALDGEPSLADFCATSNLGRDHFRHRLALVAAERGELQDALAQRRPTSVARRPKLAFLFSGQGSQWAGMGSALYADEPVFRAAVDACATQFKPHLDAAITDILFGLGGTLDATAHTQPALFTLQYALCQLWQSWGITPDILLGHSIGEYAAACAAGVFSLAEGAQLVAARGRLMQSLPAGGAMLSVALGEAAATEWLERRGIDLALAAINGEHSSVLSGTAAEILRAEAALMSESVRSARLTVSHAFHSPLMEPILDEFHHLAAKVAFQPPRIPLASTLTGTLTSEVLSADYWTQQLRQPVRFTDAMRCLRQQGCTVFVEIGPRPVLIGMARADNPEGIWLNSLQTPGDAQRQMLTALAGLHCAGIEADWVGFHAARPYRRATLPTTPFDRQRLWIGRGPNAVTLPPLPPAAATPTAPTSTKPTVIARLRSAALADRPNAVEHALRRMVASVLGGARPEALDVEEPLNRLGLDSLMAMGLRNELAMELGFETTLAQLVGDETLETLTARVLTHLFSNGEKEPLPAEGSSPLAGVGLGRGGQAAPYPTDTCPLSYGQRALWFLWDIAPNSSAYALSLPLAIDAPTNATAWHNACRTLVECHPMLRSIFPRQEGEPVQQVLPPDAIDWQEALWSQADVDAAHAQPFDLECGPVIRFRWFDKAEGGALLLISMHHIVSDGWSLELIRRQLPKLAAGEAGTIAEGYHAEVRRQLQMLQGPRGEQLWRFWQEHLHGDLPQLDLPTDFPRPPIKSFCGAGRPFVLGQETAQGIKALGREQGVTPYATFLAAFLALLHRFSGQDDVLVGSPQSGRTRPEVAHLVGYFTDPLLIRSRLQRQESFRDLLGQTRRTVLEGLEHAEFPFALLVERLHPVRTPNRSPLFDTSFNFTAPLAHEPDGAPSVAELSQADGKFDLTLNLRDGATVSGWFGYDTRLFRPESIERLIHTFKALLAAAVAEPDRPVTELPLTPSGDFVPVLCGRHLKLSDEDQVHRRIAAIAERTPQAPALVASDATLSYGELNQRANRLAGLLLQHGIGPGKRVGLDATRTAAFVVAILAIHKAGAAYVPLDTAWPPELRADTVQRYGIVVLPDEDLDLSPLDALTDTAIVTEAQLDDPAYAVFTSGSTGIPKGVLITHRALANYVVSMTDDLGFEASGRFALVSTLAADLGLTMLFPALCCGGCLHLLPEETTLDGDLFADYLQKQRIDYLKIVPSHLAALTAGRITLPLKALVLGGEAAAPAWVTQLQQAAPDCRIFNHYGPTETTIGVLSGEVFDASTLPGTSLPLTRAVANSEIFLIDRNGVPVPPGAIGELQVAGPCLAQGYLQTSEQESFVVRAGRRLYGTGDLARQNPDGAIEILGRRDRQLKLRGFRIEPGQIETALCALPGIERALVIPDADGSAASRLLAFVVTGAHSLAENELRRRLEQTLPTHMQPDRIVTLNTIPLTANGKADVAALRQLARRDSAPEETRALPRDSIEVELAHLWAEVLDITDPGIDDDFFRLGGHSLLAVRLLARIQQRFGRRITLAALLTHPTIATLADRLRATASADDHPILVPLRASGNRPPLFLLPGAGGSILYFVPLVRHLPPEQPVWALQALGHGDNEPIPERIEDIATHYVALIRKLQPEGPYHFVGHSFGALVAFEMASQLKPLGQPVAFLGLIDNAAPSADEAIPQRSDCQWLRYIALRIGKISRTPLELADSGQEDYAGQVQALIRQLVAARLLPTGITTRHFVRFIEIYKANAIAASRYRPDPLTTVGRAVLFRATEGDADLELPEATDATLGWTRLLPSPPHLEPIPGTHLTMFSENHAAVLAQRISSALETP